MQRTSTSRVIGRRQLVAGLISLLAGLGACAAPPAASRPTVPQPGLDLSPAQLVLAPGEPARLVAHPRGGEAILFHVDWQLIEGTGAGRLEASDRREDDGGYAARYVAPPGEGVFHVVARLREYPAVEARAEIRVRR